MIRIVPKPNKIEVKEGCFVFDCAVRISLIDGQNARWLDYGDLTSGASADFENSDGKVVKFEIDEKLSKESYSIDISSKSVVVRGGSLKGVINGEATLKQMLFSAEKRGVLPCVHIEDEPKFGYRGFMLDPVRHFFGVETVKKMLDAMALFKLNVLHVHLCDNQGYRLESAAFPKLNQIGSTRAGTRGDGKPVSGYYNVEQMREIIEYAASLGIDVLPEIDLPGHTIAMLASYPELSCTGKPIAVAEDFCIRRELLCVGNKNTEDFLHTLLKEICEIFPYPYIHLGGDEAPKLQWQECEVCKAAVRERNLRDFEDLQGDFVNRLIEYVATLGKTAVVWNESLNSGILTPSARCQYWQDGKNAERVKAALASGREVVVSKFSPYYLDYPHGMSSLKKAYTYDPASLCPECADKIVGVESPLWTEYVANEDRLGELAFPRLAAVAENGWSDLSGSKRDFGEFSERLGAVIDMLSQIGLKYTPIAKATPNFLVSGAQLLSFGVRAFDFKMLSSLKNVRSTRSVRRI